MGRESEVLGDTSSSFLSAPEFHRVEKKRREREREKATQRESRRECIHLTLYNVLDSTYTYLHALDSTTLHTPYNIYGREIYVCARGEYIQSMILT